MGSTSTDPTVGAVDAEAKMADLQLTKHSRAPAFSRGPASAGAAYWFRTNTVYLGLGMRLSGQLDILRLMTRGLVLGLR